MDRNKKQVDDKKREFYNSPYNSSTPYYANDVDSGFGKYQQYSNQVNCYNNLYNTSHPASPYGGGGYYNDGGLSYMDQYYNPKIEYGMDLLGKQEGSFNDTSEVFINRKTAGKKKVAMEYIESKCKRGVTFSKRKKGIMKKAYELSILTGSEILLLVTSESGHVYTFATYKFKVIITQHDHLIQKCLCANSNQKFDIKNEESDSNDVLSNYYNKKC